MFVFFKLTFQTRMLSQTQETKNKWGIHKGCSISHLAQNSMFGYTFKSTEVFVHKKTLRCYTDLSSQNCHFEFKDSCYHSVVIFASIFSPSNYSLLKDEVHAYAACCLGKKTLASELNTSECNILSRKWNNSVFCNAHLLTQYPQKIRPRPQLLYQDRAA